jgi:hypothetical protein
MKQYDVAAYIWPAYTGDEPRSRLFWPEGIGEWESVRGAKSKFPGHQWPRKPLWGYMNEADPAVMEMQINQATRHGVNVFIYDWYWFDRRPFLENCLNDGFLKAPNNTDMKFYLMWANHNANALWDRRLSGSDCASTVIWSGKINRQDFEEMAERLVAKYFGFENYYRIDGKPVFMLYDVRNFIHGMGSLEAAADALAWLRQLAVRKGHPGIFLQACVWNTGTANLSGADGGTLASYPDAIRTLGVDSVNHYNYPTVRTGDYLQLLEKVSDIYSQMAENYEVPYFPCVSCGWDNNPRFPDKFMPNILTNNTPENVEKAFRLAKDYIDTHDLPAKLVTINSWNEWTESSYLQPDDVYGYGYLEAVKKVFVDSL